MKKKGCHITVCFASLALILGELNNTFPLLLDPSEILPWFSTLASNLPHHVLNSWQLVSLLIHTQNPKASAFSLLHVELMGLKFAMLDCQGGKKQTVLPYHRMR